MKRTFELPDGRLVREAEFVERPDWDEKLPALMEEFRIGPEHEDALGLAIEDAKNEFSVEGIAIDLSIHDAEERKARAKKLRAKAKTSRRAVVAACDLAFANRPDDPRLRAATDALAIIVESLDGIAREEEAGPKPKHDALNKPLVPAAKILVEFWETKLGRKFRSDHAEWDTEGHGGPTRGWNRGSRFVYDALALTGIPRERLDGLATLLRSKGPVRANGNLRLTRF